MSGNTIVLVIVFMFSIECMLLLSANRVFMLTSTLRDILMFRMKGFTQG